MNGVIAIIDLVRFVVRSRRVLFGDSGEDKGCVGEKSWIGANEPAGVVMVC